MSSLMTIINSLFFLLLLVLVINQDDVCRGQQTYVNNKQLDCDKQPNNTKGYVCNGVNSSCISYLTFRANPPYNTPSSIAHLLNSQPSLIASINNISSPTTSLPPGSMVIVPLNCSCTSGGRYQHNAYYTLMTKLETYFTVANLTYGGLTTCQILMTHNPWDQRNLSVGFRLTVPLMCACPSAKQASAGFKFLLAWLVTWNDKIEDIADTFGVPPQSVLDANELSSGDNIYPFTTILVPLTTQPPRIELKPSPPPPAPSPPLLPTVPVNDSTGSSRKWVFIGVGVGVAVVVLSLAAFLVWFLLCRRRRRSPSDPAKSNKFSGSTTENSAAMPADQSWSLSSQKIQYAVESLMVYKFQDIQKATDHFSESNRIYGSVYRGSFNGDSAAVKMMKGDVSGEINILKKINHSNVIRLSGFCLHEGNTYLVYEFADKGSLCDWIQQSNKDNQKTSALSWLQRVQIACDVADALNYLHNFVNPPYIHKNLNSSNILLDGNFRAKVANFGLARTVPTAEGLQLTRHVVGTQGYMAPEYIENGVITPKLDVFAFGVVLLELLSGKEAVVPAAAEKNGGEELLSASISQVLEGQNVREKLRDFVDPSLKHEYPLDLAFSMAHLAKSCIAHDMNSRPGVSEILMTLSKILSSSLDWDPADELERSRSARN